VPSIPVPHVSDQFAWSEELQRLGVAPSPLRRTKLSAKALASRISDVLNDPRKKAAAVAMRGRMQSDNGPETAVDLIESAVALRAIARPAVDQ
jgi:UDP:flavonoid glycosyltransferase YjiC (YdhE family)